MREPYSFEHFEWDASADISFPGAFGGMDFDNRGDKGIEQQIERNQRLGVARRSTVETTDRFLYLNGGLWGQIGNVGMTVTADMLRYDVAGQTSQQPTLAVGLTRLHAAVAYGFLHNQLCVGAGLRLAYVDLSEAGQSNAPVISMFGFAPQAGLIVKPESHPWRLGLTVRAPVSASDFSLSNLIRERENDSTVVRRAGPSFIVPSRIVQPWEVEAGIAYQLGPRPLNPPWEDPRIQKLAREGAVERQRTVRLAAQTAAIAAMPATTALERYARAERAAELAEEDRVARAAEDAELKGIEERLLAERKARYANWPRERVLLLASVLMTGPSTDAVALEGFIDQRREIVGSLVSISPHFAVEGEAMPNRLTTRAGMYVEPSRFSDGTPREHLTIGIDVRLFRWSVFGIFDDDHEWQVSAFLDLAERYQNFGLGVGTWH